MFIGACLERQRRQFQLQVFSFYESESKILKVLNDSNFSYMNYVKQ